MKYLKKKNKANSKLLEYYEKDFLRKIKLRQKINTQRSENKLFANLNHKFNKNGKEVIMIIGDGQVNPSMKYKMSTPNKGLKKLLNKHFECYHINEFRTSCLDYRTTEENLILNKNLTKKMKNGKYKKVHSVLVSKILNKKTRTFHKSFQQRDKNSVKNMKNITKNIIENQERPYWFRRSIKLPTKGSGLSLPSGNTDSFLK